MKPVLLVVLLSAVASTASAQNTAPIAANFIKTEQPKAVKCSLSQKSVTLPDGRYKLYETNLRDIKLIKCEQVQIGKIKFYTVQVSGEIHNAPADQKVKLYEVVMLDSKKKLSTVRTETIDQIELSGDPASLDFRTSLAAEWGQHKKDKRPMIKMEFHDKTGKSDPLYVKLNAKSDWMEDVFADPPPAAPKK